jgi:hypothetical protein
MRGILFFGLLAACSSKPLTVMDYWSPQGQGTEHTGNINCSYYTGTQQLVVGGTFSDGGSITSIQLTVNGVSGTGGFGFGTATAPNSGSVSLVDSAGVSKQAWGITSGSDTSGAVDVNKFHVRATSPTDTAPNAIEGDFTFSASHSDASNSDLVTVNGYFFCGSSISGL